MKSVVAFWTLVLTVLGGLLVWRNRVRYQLSWPLIVFKSAAELAIIGLTAMFLPALLIVWLVVWVTRPIKTPWLRTVIGVLSGVCFGFVSNVAAELLLLFGVFCIDTKTGQDSGGFMACWRQAKTETDVPAAA